MWGALLAALTPVLACHQVFSYANCPSGTAADGGTSPGDSSQDVPDGSMPPEQGPQDQSAPLDGSGGPGTLLSLPGAVVQGKQSLAITSYNHGYVVAWSQYPSPSSDPGGDQGNPYQLELWVAVISSDGTQEKVDKAKVGVLQAPLDLLRVFALQTASSEPQERLDFFFSYSESGGGSSPSDAHHWTLTRPVGTTQWAPVTKGDPVYALNGDVFWARASDNTPLGFGVLGERTESVGGVNYRRITAIWVGLDNVVEEEFWVTTVAPAYQRYPRGAGLAGRFFVVWRNVSDSPDRTYWLTHEATSLSQVALPVDAQGTPVEPDPGADQVGPQVTAALRGRDLVWVAWQEEGAVSFLPVASDEPQAPTETWTARWAEPQVLIPANRHESMDFASACTSDSLGLVWESDRESALTQIRAARIPATPDTPAGPLEGKVITDPAYGFCCPQLAGGKKDLGVVYLGSAGGEQGVFFQRLAVTDLEEWF